MPWLRDPVVRTGDLSAMQAYLERSFQALDTYLVQLDERVLQLQTLRAIVGVRIRYAWDDTIDTVATPAAAGFIKANNAVAANITEFSASRFDTFGRFAIEERTFARPIQNGFYQVTNVTRDVLMSYDISGVTITRANDILVQVSHISSIGAPPQADDRMEAQYWPEVPSA